MVRLEFTDDPVAFLDRAGDYLADRPVISTVVASVTGRIAGEYAEGVRPDPALPRWWVTAIDEDGTVVGAGMRTATGAPYALFLLPMPDQAAVALARALHDRDEEAHGVNGALPAARICADELARLDRADGTSAVVEVAQHTRLHELGELVEPAPVAGRLRLATDEDLPVAADWFAAFMAAADEQAGRAPGSTAAPEPPDPADVARRIRGGQVWLWLDDSGQVVHLTAASAPQFGVARIGPVFTPPEQRGRGWASAAVAAVSRRVRDAGSRVCLFTDQANPTSNKIYARLGYRPVTDMASLTIRVDP